ncbi:Endonuclease/exonuclease/phosphatase [Hyaloraphidium curvatum]|nr:Endonuclease/exonuclease/phosphatase [Hyaloraphidium curvatum]
MAAQDRAAARASLVRLLRPAERPRALAPVKYVLLDGERKNRLVAVVVSTEGFGDEASVFVWKRIDDQRAVLYLVIPILKDFRIGVGGQHPPTDPQEADPRQTPAAPAFGSSSASQQVVLSIGRVSVILEAADASSGLQEIIAEATLYRKSAEARGYAREGFSHRWIQYYALRTNLLLGPSSVEWVRPPTPATPSAATGSAEDMDAGALAQEIQAPITTTTTTARAAALDPNAYNPAVYFASAVPARAVGLVRDTWVAKELAKTEASFTGWEELRVLVGTYNAGGKLVSQPLAPWLKAPEKDKGAPPDLLVLGLQEIDASTQAYLYNDATIPNYWLSSVSRALDDAGYNSANYRLVAQAKNVGMFVAVYVRLPLLDAVRDVSTTYVGTGLLWRMGNKGCVAVRMRVHDSFVCVVNAHLAADVEAVERRNADFADIIRRAEFPWVRPGEVLGADGYVTGVSLGEGVGRERYGLLTAATREWREMGIAAGPPRPGGGAGVFDADHLIWLGDLNYRIAMGSSDIRAALAGGRLADLLAADQLRAQRARGTAFAGFREAPLSFPPTYKFDVGTNTYDTSEKQRAPAWPDRILWCDPPPADGEGGPAVECGWYRSAPELTGSDHKPVSAMLRLRVRRINRPAFDEHHLLINRLLDKYENDAYSDVSLSTNMVDFGEVRYLAEASAEIIVENVGKIAANFDILFPSELQAPPDPQARKPASTWLAPTPQTGTLLPKASVPVRLVAAPGAEALRTLNRGEPMDEVLVVRVLNGSEKFVSASGRFLPSCFGLSLRTYSALAASGKSVRELGAAALPGLAPTGKREIPESLPTPLVRMVNWLMQHGMDVAGLFSGSRSANPKLELYIRECLDLDMEWSDSLLTGRELGRSDSQLAAPRSVSDDILAGAWEATLAKPNDKALAVHCMSGCLLRFLADLDEGVVPSRLVPRLVTDGSSTVTSATMLLRQLPDLNFNAFMFVVQYLKELLANYPFPDQMSPELLASTFAPVLIRTPAGAANDFQLPRKLVTFLLLFLADGGDGVGLGITQAALPLYGSGAVLANRTF